MTDEMLSQIEDLARELLECELSMHIHIGLHGSWVVWLYAADDPALGVFLGEHPNDLGRAMRAAFTQWRGQQKDIEGDLQ